jgi:protein-L-isoaspartate(D-aspartate) O-methyltransferase
MTTGAKSRPAGTAEADFEEQRLLMVNDQIRSRGVLTPSVLDAMRRVPRHEFVPENLLAIAYADQPLPIGERQTISQPYMVAAMTEALELTGTEKVLEVGTGSGYQAAILSLLAAKVITIEWHAALAEEARQRLARLGYDRVRVIHGDGTLGYAEEAPFDAIIVTAAAPAVPPPLVEQLVEGGRLVIPVGDTEQQDLLRLRKHGGKTTTESLHLCRFVPLLGRHGWKHPSR